MSGTLVDTNVLLDVVTKDVKWAARSVDALEAAAISGSLFINDVIYAELSVGFTEIEEVDRAVSDAGLTHIEIPKAALFLAGKAFLRYRASHGARTSILPDFFIGAHAAVSGAALLTRDSRRYRSYFPTVQLIEP
jgi:predicted nucleic acid-binding protein